MGYIRSLDPLKERIGENDLVCRQKEEDLPLKVAQYITRSKNRCLLQRGADESEKDFLQDPEFVLPNA